MKTMQLILSPYRSIKHKINQLPWLKSFKQKMKEAEYEERFAGNCYGCFRGVFETFEEAILSAPKTKNVGYDDTQLAQWYINNLKQKSKTYGCPPPRIYDYPMLFWLKDIVKEGTTIFRFPLYEGKKFVTLQNGGEVFYPQYVFNRKEFIDSFSQMGYHLIDEWKDPMGSCKIPFYPEYSVPCYSGLYFKLAN